jgi:RNA polymerase sigma-70 factor (ECF subfamily)
VRVRGTAEVAALERLYEQRYHRFLRVAEAIVGDPDLARDVVQESFVRMIRGRRGFRGEGAVERWAWRTVVNTARSARRDQPRAHAPLDEGYEPSTNGHRPDAALRGLLAALPERQRLVLFLRYYADLDYRRIAEVLEIEPGTVGATLNHAHAALRRALEEVST